MTVVVADWRALAESIRPYIPALRQDVAAAAVGSQNRLVEAAVADPSPQIVVVATANEGPEEGRSRERRRW